MLVAASGATALAYLTSSAVWLYPVSSMRYLVGMYVCAPLVVAPLCEAAQRAGQWLPARAQPPASRRWPIARAWMGAALLGAILVLQVVGLAQTAVEASGANTSGPTSPTADANILSFFRSHGVNGFYADYWTCYRLMFESREQTACAVYADDNVFVSGRDRMPTARQLVTAAPHPAYVIPLSDTLVTSAPLSQMERSLANDPRFRGYTRADVGSYAIFYWAQGAPS